MISVKSAGEIAIMREGGRILAQVLEELMGGVRPGMSTLELDKSAEEKIRKAGAKPAFLHYQGFPNTLCASLNNEVVHFTAEGLNHLIYKSSRSERNRNDQITKFKLLSKAKTRIDCSICSVL